MPMLRITDRNGVSRTLEGRSGYTLMEVAVQNDVVGIDADCRGSCACATCHVHIGSDWLEVVGAPNALEKEILELADNVGPSSRLSCQIRITDALDGLEVRVP